MAEVNAFSIDGTKYQLTATDQTYVGETGLAQLGLDYTCTPDEMNQALADAGGGTVLVNGSELYSAGADGWGFDQDSTGENITAQGIVCMRSTGLLHRSRLWLYGRADSQGIRTRGTSGEDATYDGTEWAILMYGAGDTWSPGTGCDCVGEFSSTSNGYFYFTIPLPAIAPGVSSVSVAYAGNCYVRDASGSIATVTSTSKFSSTATSTGIGSAHVRFRVSGLSGFDAYSVGTIYLPSDFIIKFS